jgi:type II secretory pathway pseudopilin PulG
MFNKKNKGFTLIETMLYVGIVAVMMISIFKVYSKLSTNAKVSTMTSYMKVIDNNITGAYTTALNFGTISNVSVIASGMIPHELVSGTSIIGDMFGGQTTVAPAVVAGNPAYSLTLSQIPNEACTKIATGDFASMVQEVAVNGATVKVANAPINSAAIIAIANACKNVNNTVVYRNTLIVPTLDAVGNVNPIRNKETPYYIATVGNPSNGIAPSCAGGTSWDGGFCNCPTGTEWNGSSCVAFGTATPQAGWCPFGQGWLQDTRTCAPLPNSITNPQNFAGNNGPVLPCAAGEVYAPGTQTCTPLNVAQSTGIYAGDRNLPGTITTTPFQTVNGADVLPTAGTATVGAISPYDSKAIGSKTIVWGAGNTDNLTVQTCVNGAWDPTTLRCVTP